MGSFGKSSWAIANYPILFPQLEKANRARLSWLREKFVQVAEKVHKQARAKPKDEFKFDGLHSGNGEWIARFVQPSTGAVKDLTETELKNMIASRLDIREFRALFYVPLVEEPVIIRDDHMIDTLRRMRSMKGEPHVAETVFQQKLG